MQPTDFQNPPLECDLVMRGGITSGIVYPPAVLVLAQQYRFRSIGGASAGAIAAAATAAAEFGREQGGFDRLQEHSAWLARASNLFDLFQPSPETRPLWETLFAAAGYQKRGDGILSTLARLTPSVVRHDRGNGLMKGAIGGAAGAWLFARLARGSLRGPGLIPAALLTASGALVGGASGGFMHLWRIATDTLPQDFYGLCSGHNQGDAVKGPQALTDWLHATLNDLAGRSAEETPLTFRELRTKQITLKLVTSNLSQSRPYHLPIEENIFLFHEDDMRRLFPEPVVQYMISHAYQPTRVSLAELPGFHYLPAGDALPVIVATRMSLSFPLLLSAVPLYTVETSAFRTVRLRREDLQQNWMSDGGISINFPIHFFDTWLPERPTFGITLTKLPPEALKHDRTETTVSSEFTSAPPAEDGLEPDIGERKAIVLPKANRPLPLLWEPINDVRQFLGAIFTTAQSYRDTMQSRLPSYRDRVVQVQLAEDEGGLNLAMTPETIATVERKGRQAGQALLHDFDFNHHRWVRFQVLMAQLEAELHDLEHTYATGHYRDLISSAPANPDDGVPYKRGKPWVDEALRRFDELSDLIKRWREQDQAWQATHPAWGNNTFFASNSPKPEPILRVTPDL